jgi:toxin ParE1/3/4
MSQFSLTDPARADLNAIWDYIAQDSISAADGVLSEIYDTLVRLSEMPGMGRRREELAPNLRSFPVNSYIIYYQRIEDGIEVMRVLHGSRDVSRLFPL